MPLLLMLLLGGLIASAAYKANRQQPGPGGPPGPPAPPPMPPAPTPTPSTQGTWLLSIDNVAAPGGSYRWSRAPVGGTLSNAATLVARAQQVGFANVQVWMPGQTPPSDWPQADLDPSRIRFQGDLPQTATEVDFPSGVTVWEWQPGGAGLPQS